MAWIESHDELPTHPKTLRAARKLKTGIPAVIGHLHMLWYWCLTHRPDGVLSDMDADDVADAAGWTDEGEQFVKALLAAGWLDDVSGTLVVHDWWDGAGKTITRRKFATKRQRKARESQTDDTQVEDQSHDSHADVTRDTSVSHGADSDIDSDSEENTASASADPNGFEEFWEAYPKRDGIKRGKKQAKAKWSKLKPVDRDAAMRALPNFQAAIDSPAFCPIPDAVRWLTNREFDDWQEAVEPSRDLRRLRSIGTGGVA